MSASPTRHALCRVSIATVLLASAAIARSQDAAETTQLESAPETTTAPKTNQEFIATAYLRIFATRSQIVPGREAEAPFELFVRTQVAILTSPIVTDRVLSDPKIAALAEFSGVESPAQRLRSRLSVKAINESELFEVRYQGTTAEDAAQIANSVLDAYIKIQGDLEAQQTQRIVDLLDKEMDRRARELERLRQSVRALVKMTHEMTYLPSESINGLQVNVQNDPIVMLRGQRTSVEMQLLQLQASLRAREINSAIEVVALPELTIEQEQADDILRERRHALAKAREALELSDQVDDGNKLTDNAGDQKKKQVIHTIKKLEALVDRRLQDLRKSYSEHESRQRRQQQVELKAQLEEKSRLIVLLDDHIEESIKEREKGNNHALDLEFLRQDLARSEKIYEQIANEAERLKMNMRAPERVGEMRLARPEDCVQTRKSIHMGGGLF